MLNIQFHINDFCSILLCLLLGLVSMPLLAADIHVKTDRNPVSLNESFQLVYETSDSVDDDPDFSPLEAQLDILNRSQSSNVSIINGRYTSSKTWTLTVMARSVGELTLPAIAFGADSSPAYTLTVKASNTDPQAPSGFYSKITVDQEQVYAQQQLVITQQLFSNQNLSSYAMGELEFSGMDALVEPLGKATQYKTRIGERAYLVIEQKYAVYPQTSGLLKLKPVSAEARTGSASSLFFDAFGNGRSQALRAYSNALSVAVLPVPDSINVNPWLPAREFELEEQWAQDPPQFIQGEPVTRTLSIKAEGLTAAQLPPLPELSLEGVKQYPDQPLLNDVSNDTGITGYRVEKVALIPTRAGEVILPAIEIPWWNTRTQNREVARIPERTIQVRPASSTQTTTTATPAPAPAEALKPAVVPAPVSDSAPAVVESGAEQAWKMIALLLALGWMFTLLAWVLSRNRNSKSQPPRRKPNVEIEQHFRQLQQACRDKDAAACRVHLLEWGRALYAPDAISSLSDLVHKLPPALASEIRKLDAVLYGGKSLEIDFQRIAGLLTAQFQQHNKQVQQVHTDLLEPLYK